MKNALTTLVLSSLFIGNALALDPSCKLMVRDFKSGEEVSTKMTSKGRQTSTFTSPPLTSIFFEKSALGVKAAVMVIEETSSIQLEIRDERTGNPVANLEGTFGDKPSSLVLYSQARNIQVLCTNNSR